MFQGFSQGAIDFLWGLKFHNERAWFQEHKQEFQTQLDAPMKELAVQVDAAMREEYPELGLETHVCRIYRDARRLHNRGPYKESLWFTMHAPCDDFAQTVCLFFEVAPHAYSYGCGSWDMTPMTAAKLRARIDRDPKPLSRIVRKLNKTDFQLVGDCYKRPKGDVGSLLNPWYNRKNVALIREENCEGVFFTPELFGEVMAGFRELLPVYRYLASLSADPAPDKA